MYFQFLALHSVGNKVISDVDVTGTLTAGRLSIISKFNTRLVVLIQDVAFIHDVSINCHTLGLEKDFADILNDILLLTATNSASVELVVFSFCFVNIEISTPNPNSRVMTPPVCNFM